MTQKKINYPYLPKGREIKFVAADNPFILAAKKATQKAGCRKQPTGAVLVKDGQILETATNASVTVSVCPRVLKGSKTGTDYHLCREVCKQAGHSEYSVVKNAQSRGLETKGADVYLWGHWWCCQPCWDAMIEGGIRNIYLEKDADKKFMYSASVGKIYVSGPLTIHRGRRDMRKYYESVAAVCSNFCSNVYVPHLNGTDPKKSNKEAPSVIWKINHREVASADLIIAYVGQPSLGVGAELEIARITASDIILWKQKGETVSRMALGNPSVKSLIEAEDDLDLREKLTQALKKF